MDVAVDSVTVEAMVPRQQPGARTVVDAASGVCDRARERRVLLDDVNLNIAPGSLTLVLGQPGCGKSTLLRVLAGGGERHLHKSLAVRGSVRYSGRAPAQFNVPRSLAYVSQSDDHLPTLTVRETLEFAHRCQQGGGGASAAVQPTGGALSVDEVIDMLHLQSCQHTNVGSSLIRGVSGGEKKRLTLGEMLVGPQVGWCLDEVTTGLDSATALDVFRALKRRADAEGHWIVAALLQPPPEVAELFDDVVVLQAGAVVYRGPRAELDGYLERIGQPVPSGTDMADWVQHVDFPALPPPLPPAAPTGGGIDAQIEAAKAAKLDLEAGGDEGMPAWVDRSLSITPAPWWSVVRLLIWRQAVILFRNKPLFIGRVVQACGRALFVSSVFYDLPFEDFTSRGGVFLFALMALAMGSLIAIGLQVGFRATLFKHRDSDFFPLSAFVVADMLSTVPLSLLEATGFTSIMYFLCGLTESSDASFPIAIFILFSFGVAMSEWIKLMAAFAPNSVSAMPLAGVTVVLYIVHSGFVSIGEDTTPVIWAWLYHVSPLGWGMRALAVNEFDSPEYRDTLYTLADNSTESAGQIYLSVYGFEGLRHTYVWTCCAVLAAETLAFMTLNWMALQWVRVEAAAIRASSGSTGATASASAAATTKTGAYLSFDNINYFVHEELQLLRGVTGAAAPGRVLALMGASGAGKTTLLDVLAGRKTQGRIEGSVLVNGRPKDDAVFARAAAYVEQQDVHAPEDTVREAVAFSARLRGTDNDSNNGNVVDTVLRVLELDAAADRAVRELTFEARKKLTIAVELVSDPAVLFLDEPTSGLDARGAAIVMRAIRNVADTGRTVVCTVHQPSGYLVGMFDDLLLLQRGGRAAYFGPFAGVVPHLEAQPGVARMPAGTNPATFMLEVLMHNAEADFGAAWDAVAPPLPAAGREPGPELQAPPHESLRTAAATVAGRMFRWYWRAPSYTLARFAFFVFAALVFGSSFTGSEYDTAPKLLARCRLMFMSSMFVGFVSSLMVQGVSAERRAVWYRERAAGMYGPAVHAWAGGIVELPYVVVLTLIFSAIFVPLSGFSLDLERFLWFWFFLVLYVRVCMASAQFFVEATANELFAQLGVVFCITFWVLFAGILKPSDTLPAFWKIFFWLSPINYVCDGLISTQWHGDESLVTTLLGEQMPVDEFLETQAYVDWHFDNRWRNVAVLAGYAAVWRVGVYWAAFKKNYQRR